MPAFPNRFVRHTMLWTLPGTENASCTVAWDPSEEPVDLDATADALATRGLSLWSSIKGRYCPDVNYVGSWTRVIETNNHIYSSYSRGHAAVPGTHGHPSLPNECAVVASMYTALAGKSHRGRIYLPCPAAGELIEGGVLGSGLTDEVADAMDAYLAPINIGAFETYRSVIASPTLGQLNAVVGGRVGDVVDSQRPRRASQVEVYSVWPS